MNFKAILDKVRPTSNKGSAQVVMLGNDAIYISPAEQFPQITCISLVNGDWESALKQSLNSEAFTSGSLQLIVCANYYQTYQIDKPDIPDNEWSVALPFLLKDLVSELSDACFRMNHSYLINLLQHSRTQSRLCNSLP